MDYFQLEVLFERIEIAIVVEEWKAALYAKSRDPTVHSLADGESFISKLAIIYGALDRVPASDHRVNREI